MKSKAYHRLRIATAATAISTTLGLSFFAKSEVRACSCRWPPGTSYADKFDKSQEVVLGRILFSFTIGEKSYTAMKPQLDAKGCISREHNTIWIESAAHESLCGVNLDSGEQYVLHLNGKGPRGTFSIGLCQFHEKLSELEDEEMTHIFAQDPQCGDTEPPFVLP